MKFCCHRWMRTLPDASTMDGTESCTQVGLWTGALSLLAPWNVESTPSIAPPEPDPALCVHTVTRTYVPGTRPVLSRYRSD